MNALEQIAIGAAVAHANGELDFQHFQRTMALLTLWAQGVDKPTDKMLTNRVGELETMVSFIGPPPTEQA